MPPRVLVTGCGGIGGVNFVNAIRASESLAPSPKFYVVGTDFNEFYLRLSSADARFNSPRHSDTSFVPTISKIVKEEKIDFLHPNPSSEARILRESLERNPIDNVKWLMPSPEAISPTKDEMRKKLVSQGVPTPDALAVENEEVLESAFSKLGSPLWIRTNQGAGARLSLKVADPTEAKLWVDLCTRQGRVRREDFIVQPYLPGRDLAYDSLWFRGKLIASSSRQRIEYPLKHISLTGLTGTPSVARSICEEEIADIGKRAVLSLDKTPNGLYSVDLKEDQRGKAFVTEVDGKWHTTAALWGMSVAKAKQDNKYNIAYQFVNLGLGLESELSGEIDLYGEGLFLIRQMDSGVVLLDEPRQRQWKIE